MKLLIALLFILPFSVQAKRYKHRNHKNHKKTWHHRFHHNNQHYLTVGSVFNFSKKTVGDKKINTYAVELAKGVIFKKKYDIQVSVGYKKEEKNKIFNYGLSAKYIFYRALAKYKKKIGTHKPYIGVGFKAAKRIAIADQSKTNVNLIGFQVGNRILISKNMMAGLEYYNFKGSVKKADKKDRKDTGFAISWSYFF